MASCQTESATDEIEATSNNQYAKLHFYRPPADGSLPFFQVTDKSGAGKKNYSHDVHEVLIQDIRGRLAQFSLAQHSFTALTDLASFDATENDKITSRLQQQVRATIRSLICRVQTVVVFDVVIRRADSEEQLRKPVKKVHIDQSPHGAWQRAAKYLPEHELTQLRRERLRFRIINIWRPLNAVVKDYPLAFADSSSINREDLVEIEHRYPEKLGQTYGVKHSKDQRFFWWSNMTPSDAILMQCFDSQGTSRCAHAAFKLKDGAEANPRQSVEIRCLVTEACL